MAEDDSERFDDEDEDWGGELPVELLNDDALGEGEAPPQPRQDSWREVDGHTLRVEPCTLVVPGEEPEGFGVLCRSCGQIMRFPTPGQCPVCGTDLPCVSAPDAHTLQCLRPTMRGTWVQRRSRTTPPASLPGSDYDTAVWEKAWLISTLTPTLQEHLRLLEVAHLSTVNMMNVDAMASQLRGLDDLATRLRDLSDEDRAIMGRLRIAFVPWLLS